MGKDTSGSGPPPGVLAACPALCCFVMTAAGRDETEPNLALQRWVRSRAWRAVDGKEPRWMFEELSGYEVERVIEDEDMGLSEEWERKLEACRA